MIELFDQRIERPSIEFLRFSWTIKPTGEDLTDFTFGILRSNSPEGPFSLLAEIKSKFYYEDFDINQHSENRIFYYKLRITEDITKDFKDNDPIYLRAKPDAIALEMIRKKNVALNFGSTAAVDVEIFIRKTWGTYCGSCFDHVKKRKFRSNCTKCFGTNFDGGYFTPVKSRVFFNVSQKSIQNIGFEIQPDNQLIEMANFPIISPGDVIKHADTRNYRVNAVRATRRGTFTISQFCQMGEVSHADIEFEL